MISRFFLKGSRPLTRLEAISRSPLINTLSETLPGFASIKAFGVEDNYLKKYYKRINDCFNINICIRGSNNWLQEMFKIFSIFYLVYLPLYYENGQSMLITLIVYFITIVLSNYLYYLIIEMNDNKKLHKISFVMLIIIGSILIYFTYHPLLIDFFRDPKTNLYGIPK